MKEKVYVVTKYDEDNGGLGKMLATMDRAVLITIPGGFQKAPCGDRFEVIGVFIAHQGNFGGTYVKTFKELEEATARGFIVPEELQSSLGETHTRLIAVRATYLGTAGLADAFAKENNRDATGKWHGPKARRRRGLPKERPDGEPMGSQGVYALP